MLLHDVFLLDTDSGEMKGQMVTGLIVEEKPAAPGFFAGATGPSPASDKKNAPGLPGQEKPSVITPTARGSGFT
ncbi:hypothetical protein [Crenobacter luteus]|uniref:hypothetical protein n=1 Tax=Crenobacter luteus TaxID=1452487 RepID=UPI0012E889CB|nr:hypothetical protein [Crenobacter luteus]